MRIGELASIAGVNTKTIRYYESIGVLPEPDRTRSGYRDYSQAAADRIAFVKNAKRLGMHLDEIREILDLRDRGQRPCDYVRTTLREQVNDIDGKIAELTRLREELIALDELADEITRTGTDGSCCPIIEHHTAATNSGLATMAR